jgi:hypothetical protein
MAMQPFRVLKQLWQHGNNVSSVYLKVITIKFPLKQIITSTDVESFFGILQNFAHQKIPLTVWKTKVPDCFNKIQILGLAKQNLNYTETEFIGKFLRFFEDK